MTCTICQLYSSNITLNWGVGVTPIQICSPECVFQVLANPARYPLGWRSRQTADDCCLTCGTSRAGNFLVVGSRASDHHYDNEGHGQIFCSVRCLKADLRKEIEFSRTDTERCRPFERIGVCPRCFPKHSPQAQFRLELLELVNWSREQRQSLQRLEEQATYILSRMEGRLRSR